MTDFVTIVKNLLDEQGRTTKDLFEYQVISKDTFYKYKHRNPSLTTLIRVANFLKTSIDYMYERIDTNNFLNYTENQGDFYNILLNLINESGMSSRQFCKDLNYSKDNLLRYKNGVMPSVRTLFEIADYFGCNIDDLLTRKKSE